MLLAAVTVYSQQGKNGNQGSEISGILDNIEKEELSEKEKTGLLFLYEEEKLARDYYAALYEKWNRNIFRNISASEQTHMNAIKELLVRYNINVPDKNAGSFNNQDLGTLYNDLLSDGLKSYENALKNSLLVEEKDIKDLFDEIQSSDNKDIRITYQNLLKGSRNHLRSFNRQLSRSGESYSPSFISQNEYNRIRNSDMERQGVITDPDFKF